MQEFIVRDRWRSVGTIIRLLLKFENIVKNLEHSLKLIHSLD